MGVPFQLNLYLLSLLLWGGENEWKKMPSLFNRSQPESQVRGTDLFLDIHVVTDDESGQNEAASVRMRRPRSE